MNLLKLIDYNDEPVYIVPDKIAAVKFVSKDDNVPLSEDFTRIYIGDSAQYFEVKNSLDEVLAALKDL